MGDDRADLIEEFWRVIAELRPELSAMRRLRTQNGVAECAWPETLQWTKFSFPEIRRSGITRT